MKRARATRKEGLLLKHTFLKPIDSATAHNSCLDFKRSIIQTEAVRRSKNCLAFFFKLHAQSYFSK